MLYAYDSAYSQLRPWWSHVATLSCDTRTELTILCSSPLASMKPTSPSPGSATHASSSSSDKPAVRIRQTGLGRTAARVAPTFSHASSANWLHYVFRFGCALIGANPAGYWVLNWVQQESQRFPSGNPQAIEYFFSGFGQCGPVELLILLSPLS